MKPSEGITRIDAATTRAHEAIDSAASMFQGTVPPRPWPSPELYKALDDVADVRDRLDVFVRHGDPDFNAKTPQVARVVSEVQRRIDAVELATRALQERRELVSTRGFDALVATPAKALATAVKSPKVLGLAALAYLLWQQDKRR
jgi:hypothetical protein